MPTNPFARDPAVTVGVGADTDQFNSAIGGARSQLLNFRTAVGGLGLALSGLATGAVVKSIQQFQSFEDQLADLEKVTSEETMEGLSKPLEELSTRIPVTAEQLATLATQAGKFGAQGEEEIMSFVESISKITVGTELTADAAGRQFAKIAGAVGLPMSEISKLGNATNSLADSMKTDATEITDAATRSANVLSQQFGLSADQVLALNASMNEVSPSSRRASGGLRRAAEALMDPGKVEDIASALGMTAEEFRTMREEAPMELLDLASQKMAEGGQAARELSSAVGTRPARAFSKLGSQLDRTDMALAKVNDQFREQTSLQREMNIRTDTLSGQLQLLRSQIAKVSRSVGGQFVPHLKNLRKNTLGPLIESFSNWNESLNGMPATIGLVATAIGGAAVAMLSFLGGPITLLIGGIAALGAAVATNFGGMRDAARDLLATFGTAFAAITDVIDTFRGETGSTKQSLLADFEAIVAQGVDLFQEMTVEVRALLNRFRKFWSRHGEEIAESTIETFTEIQEVIQSTIGFIYQNLIQPVLSTIQAEWAENGEALISNTVRTFNFIQVKITEFVDELRSLWDAWGDEITTIVEATFDAIASTIGAVVDVISTAFTAALAALRGDWETVWSELGGLAEDILTGIIAFVEKWGDDLLNAFVELITGVTVYIGNQAVNLLQGAFNTLVDAISAAFDGLVQTVIGSGSGGQIGGMIDSITTFIEAPAKEKVRMAFHALGSAIRTVILGVVDAIIGAGGLIKGMVEDIVTYVGSGQANQDIKNAFTALIAGVTDAWKAAFNLGGTIWNILENFIADVVTYVASGQAWQDIKSAFGSLMDIIMAAWEGLYTGLIGQSLIPEMFQDIAAFIVGEGKDLLRDAVDNVINVLEDLASIDMALPDLPDWVQNMVSTSSFDVSINFPNFTWSNFIDDLHWFSWIDDLDWTDWLGATWSFSWTDWLGYTWEFSWSDWIPDLNWDDFIDDLTSLGGFQHGGFIPSGTEGLAALHGPEYIVPQDDMAKIAGAGAGGGGKTLVMNNTKIVASTEQGGRDAARGFVDEVRSQGFRL